MQHLEIYICSECQKEVANEQTCFDKYDLDGMCQECYTEKHRG